MTPIVQNSEQMTIKKAHDIFRMERPENVDMIVWIVRDCKQNLFEWIST